MALVLADRVRDTTTTTGTGTVTLSGTAPTGYQNFSVVGNGNTTYYTINGGSEWEVGIGTYSSTGPTLARTTILASSNSGSPVNFSAGTKDVFVTYPAEKSVNYDASNRVGIGTTAPSNQLSVGGNTSATISFDWAGDSAAKAWISTNFSSGEVRYAAVTNYFPTFYADNAERMRIDTSGNVGVGTTTMAGRFNVTGATTNLFYGVSSTNNAALKLVANSDVNTICNVQNSGGNLLLGSNGTGEYMRIDASGNVGIGTSSPNNKLDVNGSVNIGAALLTGTGVSTGDCQIELGGNRTGNGNAYIDFHATAGTDLESRIIRYGGTNGGMDIINAGTGGMVLSNSGAAPMAFQTSAAERMRIDSAGNVGIGTTNPSQKLHVVGGTVAQYRASGDNNAFYGSTSDTSNNYLRLQNTTGILDLTCSNGYSYLSTGQSVLFFGTSSTERMRLDGSGNLGIGTSTVNARLNVKGGMTWIQNFNGSASSPTEAIDWPVPALNVTSFGDFTLQTMMTFTLPNDGNYFTGDTVWNIRLEQTASSITSSSSTGFRLFGPGYLAFGSGQQERLRFSTSGGITSSDLADAVGYKGLPQNQRTGAYTLALSDMGKHIYATAANFNITIPANSSVAFPIGTAITIVVEDQFHTLVPAAGVTLVLAGTGAGTTGTRTLAQGSVATIIKVGTDRWYVSGAGVT